MSDIPLMPLSITDSSLRTSYWMSRICKGEDDSVWFDIAIIWSATLWMIAHIPSRALTDVSCSYEKTHYGRDPMCRWWSSVSTIKTAGCVKKSVKFSLCTKKTNIRCGCADDVHQSEGAGIIFQRETITSAVSLRSPPCQNFSYHQHLPDHHNHHSDPNLVSLKSW